MTIGSMLSAFFIGPLKLVFEAVFRISYDIVQHPGVSIIFLSLAMNFLVLPLYKRADAMQEQARDKEALLKDGISHIKKTFSGSERMMMLQTYYKQNDYSPANALRGSISLLLEVPFFMAAYQFLSHLELLKGVSFGPIADLGAPDAMLSIGGIAINVLPILMTLINFASAAIYLRGFPLKTKIQTYGIALVFLFFLYGSPAGLVFYWTLNNVFSLCKNIVMKLLRIGNRKASRTDEAGSAENVETSRKIRIKDPQPSRKLFVAAAAFLSLFTGLLIPSAYIAASPQEYVDPNYFFHPVWYVVSSVLLAAGFFLFWFGVFYWLAGKRGKVVFEKVMLILCVLAVVDYMFFGRKIGVISSLLKYNGGLTWSVLEGILNSVVCLAIIVLGVIFAGRIKKPASSVLIVASAAILVMSGINVVKINSSVREVDTGTISEGPHFTISKEGKNVVVLLLDRAMGEYMPYILSERPDLKELFSGFTYYSNVISFGGHTNMGAPALMGGYEYTPVEMNRRADESLKDKHNESLKVMPVLFDENGYDVTVCDAPYANYSWIPDLSIYDDHPDISTYITKGWFGDSADKQQAVNSRLRNFFCFGLMKSLPLVTEPLIYDYGSYLSAGSTSVVQIRTSMSEATGTSQAFMESYQVLANLSRMTNISEGSGNNYLFLYNDTPHEPMLLSEPDYLPADRIDNTEYDAAHQDRFTVDGRALRVSYDEHMIHYQTNIAVLYRIGDWLNYLRESGAYENTRIIIVADHGYYLYQLSELQYYNGNKAVDIGNYFPLLMYKDFGDGEFTVSDEFMTNADVPWLAVKDLIADPKNPFTGKAIDGSEKTAHDQLVILSRDWDVDGNNGNTYNPSGWAAVTGNIWDRDDWQFTSENITLTEHALPGGN